MNRAIELTYELKKELDSLPLFQEYKRVKEIIDNSSEINELKKEIARNVNNKEKHKALLEQYNSNPIVSNFKELESEVSEYLKEICDIINKK